MKRRNQWWGLAMLAGVAWPGLVVGEPDPAEVQRLVDQYIRQEEAEKKAAEKPTVDHDLIAWQSAEKCGKAACFRAYLADYPKGRYARMAQARLEPEPTPAVTERPAAKPRPAETFLADRYRDHGDGTVKDVKTGLQWMRCSLGQTWRDGTCVGKAESYAWQGTLDAAATLNRQGGYAGHRDWRVPTKEELLTLVYCSSGQPKTWNDTGALCGGNYGSPTLNQSAFPNTPNRWYWSSSSVPFQPHDPALIVDFDGGDVKGNDKKTQYNFVRLARGGLARSGQ